MDRIRITCKGLLALTMLTGTVTAEAQLVRETTAQVTQTAELVVPLYKSRILTAGVPVERVSVGNPDIADLLILRDRELYVLGRDLGTTNVLLWDRGDSLIGSVAIEVTHDLEALKQKLFELLPSEDINVHAAQRSIVLSGTVSSVSAMDAALRLAAGYLAPGGPPTDVQEFQSGAAGSEDSRGEIINLLQVSGGQQVMLEVKVAEIARTELRSLGMRFNGLNVGSSDNWNFGGVNGGASFPDAVFQGNDASGRVPVFNGVPYGPVIDEFLPNPITIGGTGFFASLLSGDSILNLSLEAAKENGLAKILAEPTLTTLSGQEAEFLSGGEFPIPVPQGVNGITIEFKEFGVGLRFVPVVLGETINLKLNITVSELTEASTVAIRAQETTSTFIVPSLARRSASATVELRDGQTMGIAGLINEDLREVVTKFPGLGSIPVLGNLFRSQDFVKGETELVIMVTPRLAKPIAPDQIRLPTDDFVEPSDTRFYLMGHLEGNPDDRTRTTSGEGGVDSDFGHEIE